MTRTALVTGGSRGLGRATALALAADGADVVVTYVRGAAAADEVVTMLEQGGGRAAALELDTSAPETFATFAAALGSVLDGWGAPGLDVLVNNAGVAGSTPLGGTTAAAVDELYAVHVRGPVLLTQELAPLLVDGGHVLNVSSGLTRFVGAPAYSVYAAMKGAVEVWTRYLAKELGPRRIAVNAIAPGATATDFAGGVIRDDERYRSLIEGASAMGRVGEPDDVGRAAAAIVSSSLSWVTGQRIEASGGQSL
ncbi:SDR family oxidoreductase [Cellulomonas sp.]|uniref:SDR family NAD(P)-dependent oxidoreductase n=1 Tax=Cellulomonas sp. TaxID=40001 RepID=UPI0025865261|nr:SDR family oxidoreductase [Cellulomonas sp.]MCR6688003.1 SDR family oxidoreductase [Cellulomonas sp.]